MGVGGPGLGTSSGNQTQTRSLGWYSLTCVRILGYRASHRVLDWKWSSGFVDEFRSHPSWSQAGLVLNFSPSSQPYDLVRVPSPL